MVQCLNVTILWTNVFTFNLCIYLFHWGSKSYTVIRCLNDITIQYHYPNIVSNPYIFLAIYMELINLLKNFCMTNQNGCLNSSVINFINKKYLLFIVPKLWEGNDYLQESHFTYDFPLWFMFNLLWPSDTISRQRSGSTLAQVMACCLTAPSHYLNPC